MATIPEYFDRVVPEVNYPLLRSKRVVVVGVGQVGAKIAAELANATIGALRFIDHDVLEERNLYRHVLPREYLGKNKADALAVYLSKQVPGLKAQGIPRRVDPWVSKETLDSWLRDADLIVGTTDDPRAQLQVAARALELDITAVFPALNPHQNGGEIIIQFDRQLPCFGCAAGFRASIAQLEGVSSLGFYGLPVIERAIELSLALLEPRSRYAQLITPRRDEPPHQVFRLNRSRELISRPLEWLSNCPACGGSPLMPVAPGPPAQSGGGTVTRPLPRWPTPPPSVSVPARARPRPPAPGAPNADQSASRNLKIGLGALACLILFVLVLAESGGNNSMQTTASESRQEAALRVEAAHRAAKVRIASLSFGCIERRICQRAFPNYPLPLFISDIDAPLHRYLASHGYSDMWSDNTGRLRASTIESGQVEGGFGEYVTRAGSPGAEQPSGLIYAPLAEPTYGAGPETAVMPPGGKWTITWRLKDRTGHVVKALRYTVKVVTCSDAAGSYCERVGKERERNAQDGRSIEEGHSYSSAAYTPPSLFAY